MKHSQNANKIIRNSRKLLTAATTLWNGRVYIGYSHLVQNNDGLPSNIETITKKGAAVLLEKDLTLISKQISKVLSIDLTQNQFDAIVCLVYDIGIKSYISSGMSELVNTNRTLEASQKFRQWSRYKKTPIYQLIKSRKMEIALFDTPMK